jgi:hypothetical protein
VEDVEGAGEDWRALAGEEGDVACSMKAEVRDWTCTEGEEGGNKAGILRNEEEKAEFRTLGTVETRFAFLVGGPSGSSELYIAADTREVRAASALALFFEENENHESQLRSSRLSST